MGAPRTCSPCSSPRTSNPLQPRGIGEQTRPRYPPDTIISYSSRVLATRHPAPTGSGVQAAQKQNSPHALGNTLCMAKLHVRLELSPMQEGPWFCYYERKEGERSAVSIRLHVGEPKSLSDRIGSDVDRSQEKRCACGAGVRDLWSAREVGSESNQKSCCFWVEGILLFARLRRVWWRVVILLGA